MKRIDFTKMVASGNDFIVIDKKPGNNFCALARALCDRKFGIGADGLLLIGKTKNADLHMRIFNADGSEAEMCGNGARCAALFNGKKKAKMLTMAGVINAQVYDSQVKIQLTDPKKIRLDIPLKVNGRLIKVSFINTGVPHVVVLVEGLDKIDIAGIGRAIRWHVKFSPAGTNVNFVEVKDNNLIRIRTYERGVEAETLACGTGSTAAALVFALKNNLDNLVKVQTQSAETLKVYFSNQEGKFKDVWLEGSAKIVYKGEYYV
ncbi:MAG: diaminopimelate epimerase [Candidatus Omnitrophica bacterium]|nr:diaminopimelate epimerase [Candidatus Omnitrophota bacterium]MBU1922879.1 diaminopimelate epimerase [Candidatus Omnitrophota bacterium]